MKTINRVMQKWVVDECSDASGNWTIRIDNGTPNGDTEAQVVATVYGLALAEHIVETHNKVLAIHAERM
jgi:hypothetical protein